MEYRKLLYFPAIFALIPVATLGAKGNASLDMPQEVIESQSFNQHFKEITFSNPAAKFFQQDYSFTSIEFNGNKDSEKEFKIAPMGKGDSFWSFNAESHLLLDKQNIVWGKASYTNGKREDVTWNETSDFDKLYPYVMADEHIGDLKYEEYFFNGGYAGQHNKWNYGASFGYRARCEYRTLDPRPNNTVADLNARIAAGYTLGGYNLSLSVLAGKYKQTNELKYFNELGADKEYHLTGIGTEFVRFSGACNDVFYKGHNFGASLELVPIRLKGFSFSALFDRFSFDKILSSLNKLALNHLNQNKFESEIAWTMQNRMNAKYGAKFDLQYTDRDGYDNMFGDATGNVYPQIGTTLMFENQIIKSTISGIYEQTINKNIPLGISPFISFEKYNSCHNGSNTEFNFSNLAIGTNLRAAYFKKRNFIQLKAGINYRIATSTDLLSNKEDMCTPSIFAMYKNMTDYLSSNETNTNVSFRYQFKLRPKTLSLFIEASWGHRFYLSNKHDNIYTLSTGISL